MKKRSDAKKRRAGVLGRKNDLMKRRADLLDRRTSVLNRAKALEQRGGSLCQADGLRLRADALGRWADEYLRRAEACEGRAKALSQRASAYNELVKAFRGRLHFYSLSYVNLQKNTTHCAAEDTCHKDEFIMHQNFDDFVSHLSWILLYGVYNIICGGFLGKARIPSFIKKLFTGYNALGHYNTS